MNVLITGGASGLGETITNRIANDPDCAIYFTFNRSEVRAKNIEKLYSNAFPIKCDFTNESDVDALSERIKDLNIDVLINNAYTGILIGTYFHKTNPEDFLTEFKNNILPTVKVTQAALRSFRKKKKGKVITILTSSLINTPPTGSSVYVSNKAYLEQLTKVWATENVKYNITSNCVSPAFMLTGFTQDIDERVIEQMKESHPLKQLLTTTEVAETVYFLLNASSQMNGVNIVMNAASNIK